jgi:DNA-binding transcriptional regulator YbjK
MRQTEKSAGRKGPVAYQGRRAARSGSEQRRRAILEATLRIIIRDGVRAVRHRAVAKEAGVPLSATTYYFKDIHDLIADTFTLFVENAMSQVLDPVWVKIYEFVGSHGGRFPADAAGREAFATGIAHLMADFVEREVTQQREHLLAEQAFMQAAVLDERLRAPAEEFRRRIVEGITLLCTTMGSADPQLDAEMIHQTFLQLEYEHLIRDDAAFDRARVEAVLAHRARLVMR